MNLSTLRNQRVLIVGLGVTGASVVRYLSKHGVSFDLADQRAQPNEALRPFLQGTRFFSELTESLCCEYDVLILSPGVPRALAPISAAISKGVLVIGDVELFASAVADQTVIAVTGSNGKSTVATWLGHVLRACDQPVVVCGNIGLPALDSLVEHDAVYVIELSSYQLESTSSLCALSAVVLNISEDHMDRYDSLEHYAAVKRTVYEKSRHCVFNRDDARTFAQVAPHADTNLDSQPSFPVDSKSSQRFFSIHSPEPGDCCLNNAANEAWLNDGEKNVVRRSALQTPGEHNVSNALAVIALLAPLDLDKKAMAKGLAGYRGLPHRTEFIRERNGVRWYNDSKGTNLDACSKAIAALSAPVVLIAGGQGKGADFASIADIIQTHVKALVLLGEDRELIATAWQGLAPVYKVDSLHDAVIRCDELSEPGDVVLLSPACASFDMFENFEQRGEQFCHEVEALVA